MKIAIYQPRASYYVGGAEVVALEHARWLSKLGHKITLTTSRAPFIKQSDYFKKFVKENRAVKTDYLSLPQSTAWLYKIPAGSNWARWNAESLIVGQIAFDYFSRKKFDVIAVHNVIDAIFVPRFRKSVLHLHGYPKKTSDLIEFGLSVPAKLIAVSKYVKKKWGNLTKLPACEVAENGVDSRFFSPLPLKKKTDVLFVGRLIPTKGVSYLLNAAKKIVRKKGDLKVSIAGQGELYRALRQLAARNRISRNVSFLGYVKTAALPILYNSAKMAVLPSYDKEGIITTMLEASACGIPVITTKACSMPEFIRNRRNGLLVAPKNSEVLARTIIELLGNDKFRQKLGREARRSIIKNWDWSKKIKKVESIYAKINVNS